MYSSVNNINNYDLYDISIKLKKELAERRETIIYHMKIKKETIELYNSESDSSTSLFRTITCSGCSYEYEHYKIKNILFGFKFSDKLQLKLDIEAKANVLWVIIEHLHNQESMYISDIDKKVINFERCDDGNPKHKEPEPPDFCNCYAEKKKSPMKELWEKKQNC